MSQLLEEKPICKKIKYAIFFNNRMYIAKLSHAHMHKLILLVIQSKCSIENMND